MIMLRKSTNLRLRLVKRRGKRLEVTAGFMGPFMDVLFFLA